MTSRTTGACWRAETQTAADLDFLDALASRGLLTPVRYTPFTVSSPPPGMGPGWGLPAPGLDKPGL